MTEIEISLNDYCGSYETMSKEIQEGIDEGFNEGLTEGIKQGFIAGIKECRDTGFDNIDVKSTEEILKIAFKIASDEAIEITVRKAVSDEYNEKVSPSFKKKMEEACSKAVEEIKNADFELDEVSASKLKNRVDASVERVRECIGSACGGVKKNLPKDMIFKIFFGSLQDEFNRDLDENLKACRMRICKEIDSKITSKKVDHE
ncbi:MAG: hypothetical protein ACPK85_04450 [Methanosarcina sp.]